MEVLQHSGPVCLRVRCNSLTTSTLAKHMVIKVRYWVIMIMLAASHLGTDKVHNSFVILWDPELGIMQGVALKAEEHACIKRHITMG